MPEQMWNLGIAKLMKMSQVTKKQDALRVVIVQMSARLLR